MKRTAAMNGAREAAGDASHPNTPNRRREARVPVGLPVDVHFAGHATPIAMELIDIARHGVRFRSLGDEATVGERATFAIFAPEYGKCTAEGHVARVQAGGEFIVALDRANKSFKDFVDALAREPLV
jgi:hypothetical protein